jgi:hypothetical protein
MIIKAFLILSQQTNNQGIIVELFAFSREQLKKGGSPLSFTHVIGKMHLWRNNIGVVVVVVVVALIYSIKCADILIEKEYITRHSNK